MDRKDFSKKIDESIKALEEISKRKEELLKEMAQLESSLKPISYRRFCSLFRLDFYDEVGCVLSGWRRALPDIPSDMSVFEIGTMRFDFEKISLREIIVDIVDLINRGALNCSMRELTRFLILHSNISIHEDSLYQNLKRYKKICI